MHLTFSALETLDSSLKSRLKCFSCATGLPKFFKCFRCATQHVPEMCQRCDDVCAIRDGKTGRNGGIFLLYIPLPMCRAG